MTHFNKDQFTFDGMYLMYHPNMITTETGYRYPSHEGRVFIARFKYGSKPWKTWVNFIVKNFTVEEYVEMEAETSPVQAMESKGFVEPAMKKELKRKGYPQTVEGKKQMIADEYEEWKARHGKKDLS